MNKDCCRNPSYFISFVHRNSALERGSVHLDKDKADVCPPGRETHTLAHVSSIDSIENIQHENKEQC